MNRNRVQLPASGRHYRVCSCRHTHPGSTDERHPPHRFLASTAEPAQMARAAMISRYGDHAPEQADVLCPLGGDGFMLQTLHRHGHLGKPVFGMKLGTVGFLMNQYRGDDDVQARIARAEPANLRPLEWWR